MNLFIVFILIIVIVVIAIILSKKIGVQTVLREENMKLQEQIRLLDNEQLKFQLQPHTVKNILANLRLFAKKLNQGMDTLSETLDYVLYNGQQQYVSVKDEMDFMKKYIKLNDLFIPGIDCIKLNDHNVDATCFYYNNICIPHLITAYFIENAFKHGDTAHEDFLYINVKLDHYCFELEVINKVQLHIVSTDRKGIGLSNMKQRLEYLSKDRYTVSFGQNGNDYVSKLSIQFDKQ